MVNLDPRDLPFFNRWLSIPSDKKPLVIAVRVLTAATFIYLIVINALTATGLLYEGQESVGDTSDRLNTFITPAGYAFLIWNVIFVGLGGYCVYQLVPRTYDHEVINVGVSWIYILNFILNGTWPILWADQLNGPTAPPLILIYLILFTLIMIYMRFRQFPPKTYLEYWLVHFPHAVYFGWILGASTLNSLITFGAWLNPAYTQDQLNGIRIGSIVVLVILLIIVNSIVITRRDPVPGCVFTWTTIAIAVAKMPQYVDVGITAAVIAGITGVIAISTAVWRIKCALAGRRGQDEPALRGSTEKV